ncbi:MAG: RNA polymerase sigma-54 factor [Phycisphaeraceae bacterium]|nr:RNA polymerase sigma-54 factor [Phycisphaeraceae bacterium]
MRIDTGQQIRLDQRMKLAPRMIQSMEILQMSSQALEARIEAELSSNPTLEVRESGTDPDQVEQDRLQENRDNREGERDLVVQDDSVDPGHADDFERLSNMSEEYGESWNANIGENYINNLGGERYRRYDGERDAKIDAMANAAARQQSLEDQLLDQWRLVEYSAETQRMGQFLIGYIDNDGYLRTDRQMLIDQMPADVRPEDLDETLELIQKSLEPVGVGARDLRECLLLQIDARAEQPDAPDLTTERLLVDRHLEDLGQNRLPKVAKSTGLELEQIKSAMQGLRHYHPLPGRLLVDDAPRRIRPDAIVEYDEAEDCYTARLTRGGQPTLQISDNYRKMQRDKTVDTKTREFVGSNLRSARWLLEAVEQRSSTLLRVISVVLEAQREFFDQGPQMLKPLPMTMVADQLGIHVATVSRAVNEKYIQSPRGIFPLRMFFSGGTETGSGDSMSWSAIQAKLQQIIDEEDKSSPLNDDHLVEKLNEHGIEIARRTVAKYRKQLNIPPARQRKEY